MPEYPDLKNDKYFEPFHYYTRTTDRHSGNYKKLCRLIEREVDVIYRKGWFDYDIDRLIVGTHCVHHGIQELKKIENLLEPHCFDESHREDVIRFLKDDHFNIENSTLNFTYHDRKGIWKLDELNIYPLKMEYRDYLKELRRTKESNGTLGKGVFLHVIYTRDLRFFSVINFTGSEYVLRKKKLECGNDLKIYLENAADIVEPCFNEVLLFMLEAYIRHDFHTLFDYFTKGEYTYRKAGKEIEVKDAIRLQRKERILSNTFKDLGSTLSLWFAIQDVMEWLLECIHFDTILEEATRKRRKPRSLEKPSYLNLVELTQGGEIFDYLAKQIGDGYEYYERSRRAS